MVWDAATNTARDAGRNLKSYSSFVPYRLPVCIATLLLALTGTVRGSTPATPCVFHVPSGQFVPDVIDPQCLVINDL
jgi:hypothetical protein